MVYEWTKVELYGANNDGGARRYAIAADAACSKGSLLYLTEERIASFAALGSAPVAGVAALEKTSGDGETNITCWTDGVFNVRTSLAIVAGDWLKPDTHTKNCVTPYTLVSSGAYLGRALQTGGASTDINVRLGPL